MGVDDDDLERYGDSDYSRGRAQHVIVSVGEVTFQKRVMVTFQKSATPAYIDLL